MITVGCHDKLEKSDHISGKCRSFSSTYFSRLQCDENYWGRN